MSSLNPSGTLYRETPCEHGDIWNPHGIASGVILDKTCPGGSREEVVIDYVEAFSTWWRHDHIQNDQERLVIAIDAALKNAGFTRKFASGKEHQSI